MTVFLKVMDQGKMNKNCFIYLSFMLLSFSIIQNVSNIFVIFFKETFHFLSRL